jgi:hypothetical protein
VVWQDQVPSLIKKMKMRGFVGCPKPPIQPRDAARREECSQLDEKSLTTFSLLNGRAKGSDVDRLNDFMRLKNYSRNDAPDRVVSEG